MLQDASKKFIYIEKLFMLQSKYFQINKINISGLNKQKLFIKN